MEKSQKKTSLRYWFRKLVHNPWVDFSVGIILAVSGLVEIIDTFPQVLSDFKLGVHHGVFLLGFATMLRAVAAMFAGLEFIDEGEIIKEEELKKTK